MDIRTIKIKRLEIFDTCMLVCDTLFEYYNLETGEGKLKPILGSELFFYCMESRCIYAIVDDLNLNCICSDVNYGSIQSYCNGMLVSFGGRLFKNGNPCNSFQFEYDNTIYKIMSDIKWKT